MFTGLVEEVGSIDQMLSNPDGLEISIRGKKVLEDLKVDDSVSCSGICLTVIKVSKEKFTVQLVEETLSRTNAQFWKNDTAINLERALLPSTRIGGHFVQGHVDCTTKITDIQMADKSAIFSPTSLADCTLLPFDLILLSSVEVAAKTFAPLESIICA